MKMIQAALTALERPKTRATISALVFVLHSGWVAFVASIVKHVCGLGDNGLQLWVLAAVPDLPVSFLLHVASEALSPGASGDFWFWSYTLPLWAYLILGSLQWAVLAWYGIGIVLWLRRRTTTRRGFPVSSE